MGSSFIFRSPPFVPPGRPLRVLVTGAAGHIGSYFAQQSHGRYELSLMVLGNEKPALIARLAPWGKVVTADLNDLDRLKEVCQGIDVVLHLAGNSFAEAKWKDLLRTNIEGTYNLFAAAIAAGCRRVVYASSIHAVSGYPIETQVKTTEPVNPGDIYGVTKVFGEGLARYAAEQEGLSAICLRIGGFQPESNTRTDVGIALLDAFVSHRDLNQLIEKSIDDLRLQFAIFHGISDTRFKRFDISDARELLGYSPADDVTQEHPHLASLHLRKKMLGHSVRTDDYASGMRDEAGDARQSRATKGN
jgi:NAD(P)-dependent dehydrogenase (short-subunit alcohol dehydrogenase family)